MYVKTNWQNLPSTNTPINANNLNKIENELQKLENITTGSGTVDMNFFSSVEQNAYVRSGNVVNYVLVATSNGSAWNTVQDLISNLPTAKTTLRFLGFNINDNKILGFNMTNDGKIKSWYNSSSKIPSQGQVLVINVTYITKDD